MATVTNIPITLSYFVRDIAGALLTYNRLRWYRSRDGKDGTYSVVTEAAPGSAVLTFGRSEGYLVVGRTLSFLVGAAQVDVVFAGTDPLTAAQVATQIMGATGLVTAADVSGVVVMTTATTGTSASIEILAGDANVMFGLVEEDGAVGTDQDTVLVSGTHEYFLTDSNSDEDFWYRVQFLNTGTGANSELSVPFPANSAQRIPVSETIVAYLRVADLSGCPIPDRRVTLHNVFIPNKVAGWGVFRHSKELRTDRNGYAEVRLLRGMVLDVVVDGTGFVRRITIPTTGDAVDLLDESLVTQDEFGIQEPRINHAIRTS